MFRNYVLCSLLGSMGFLATLQEEEESSAKRQLFTAFKLPPNPMDEGGESSPPAWLGKVQQDIDEATKIFEESKKELQDLVKQRSENVTETRFREIIREELKSYGTLKAATVSGGSTGGVTYSTNTYPATTTRRTTILPLRNATRGTCTTINGVRVCK